MTGYWEQTRRRRAGGFHVGRDTYFCRQETRAEGGNSYLRPGNRCLRRTNNRFQGGHNCVGSMNNDVRPGHDRVRSANNRFAFGNDRRRLFDSHLRGGNKYFRYGDTYFARQVRKWLIPGVQGPAGDNYLCYGNTYLRDANKYFRSGDDRRRSANNRVRDENECVRSGNDYRPLTDDDLLGGEDRFLDGINRRRHDDDRLGFINGR